VSVKSNIIFGPINSRRFGSSLGIDLSPSSKQCNFDCLYCELAPSATVNKQSTILSVKDIINELKKHLNTNIDVITLTANGEPTLYPYLNELINEIDKIKNSTQTLILTNSGNLVDKKVFQTLLKLDQVKLSLDAVSHDIFQKIDRPYKNIHIDEIVGKVIEFSKIFKGKLFIEILFVQNLNDTKEEVKKLNNVLLDVKCSRIDIGTIDRPPAYPITGINYKRLHEISLLFSNSLPIHIASRTNIKIDKSSYTEEEIVNTLDKRPLTQEDINILFDDESKNRLNKLIKEKKIAKKTTANIEFLIPYQNIKRKRKKL